MWASLLAQLIPALVMVVAPSVVEGVKKIAPNIPKVLLPVLSVALGAVSSVVGDYSVAVGGALGAAGIGVREIVDQVGKLFSDE